VSNPGPGRGNATGAGGHAHRAISKSTSATKTTNKDGGRGNDLPGNVLAVCHRRTSHTIERLWYQGRGHMILPDLNLRSVSLPASVQSGQSQARANNQVRKFEIFEVKIVYPLTKYLSFMIGLNSKTQFGVQSTKTLFQKLNYVFVCCVIQKIRLFKRSPSQAGSNQYSVVMELRGNL
jgi:hypothetical protein